MKRSRKYKLKENVKRAVWKLSICGVSLLMAFGLLDATFTKELFAANANITFNTRVLNNIGQEGTEIKTVESGQAYYLEINYQYSTAGDGFTYGNGALQIVKPDNAVFDIEGTRELMKQYPTVFSSVTVNGNLIVFNTPDNASINAGAAANLYAKFYYNNFTTPNGYGAAAKEKFRQIQYTGNIQSSSGVISMDPITIPEVTILNNAKETWDVTKNTALIDGQSYVDKGDFYEVTYQLSAKPDAGDRYGRLNCNPFLFVDTLPTATTGEIDASTGKMIGYPTGGGVSSIASIIRNYGQSDSASLTAEDYTLEKNDDGSIKTITFNPSAFNYSKNATLISDGHLMGTTFAVTVRYPKAAYEIENNVTSFDAYHLVNQVSLTYQPLAEEQKVVNAQSDVDLGWKDPSAKNYDIVVQKQVKVGSNDLIGQQEINDFTKDLQDIYYATADSKIAFTLYSDKECTKIATSWNGQNAAGNQQAIDALGQVTFKELLAGTYYLKETSTVNGFAPMKVKEVTIAKDGTIKVDNTAISDHVIPVINQTTSDGFGYVAFWKQGTSAASKDGSYLPGISFTLKQKNGTKTYTATSNEQGLVLFTGVMAGNYTLTENETADSEFLPLTGSYTVTVLGNQVNYPKKDGASLPTGDDQKPYITNTSNKGSLRILKKDSSDSSKLLTGSEFVAYGPYVSQQAAEASKQEESLKHVIDSKFTDGKSYYALAPGFYMIMETKAPQGFTMSEQKFIQEVKLNTTAEISVENDPLGSLVLEKSGQLKLDGVDPANWPTVPLLGAEFTLYTDQACNTPALDGQGNPAVIKDFQIVNGKATTAKHPLYLDAGTYYVKETKVPANYQELPVQKVEVKVGATESLKLINAASSLGRIHLSKVDAKTGNALKGATFSFTGVGEHNKDIQFTQSVGDDGILVTDFLPSGDYLVKETITPQGYKTSTYEETVTVKDNTEIKLKVTNEPLINYQIKKVDQSDHSITISNGVIFGLYASQADAEANKNPLQTRTADSNGLVTFTALNPGVTYYYKELAVNQDYTLNKAVQQFVVPGANESYTQTTIPTYENVHKGSLELIKQANIFGTTTPEKIQGIKLRIYPKTADTFETNDKTVYREAVTSTNGVASFTNLDVGSYWVEEYSLGSHTEFSTFTPFLVEVTPWSGYSKLGTAQPPVSKTINNEYAKGKLQIEKKGNSDEFVQATFTIYEKSDTGHKTPLGTIQTSIANGLGTSGFLNPGDYVLIEKSAVDKNGYAYLIDTTPIAFTIQKGKLTTLSAPITNELSGSLKIMKYEHWNSGGSTVEFPMAGVKFDVYLKESNGSKTFVKSVVSTVNGITVTGLIPGRTYSVEEDLQGNKNYQQLPPQEIVIASGDTKLVTFQNIPNKGKLKIEKKDVTTGAFLDGAKFDVYVEDAKGDTIVTIGEETLTLKRVQQNVETGTALKPDGTKDPGIAYTQFLEDGAKVYLRESKAPDGYVATSAWSGPYTIKAGGLTTASVTNFKPETGTGAKENAKHEPLSGALVALFQTQAQADNVNKILADQLMSLEELMDALQDFNSDRMGLVSMAWSGTDGKLSFPNITKGATYYAVELSAPPTYLRANGVYTVTVNSEGELLENGSKFVLANDQYGRFQLKKTATLSNKTILMDDVHFNVYQAIYKDGSYIIDPNHPDPVLTPVTGTLDSGNNGSFLSGYLAPGFYLVQEDQRAAIQPPELVISDTFYPIEIKKNETVMSLFDTPINNTLKYGKFALTKVSAQDSNQKVQAWFKLEKKNQTGAYETYPGYERFEVSKSAVYLSGFLPAGDYRMQEVAVESGYTLQDQQISFTIEAAKVTGMKDGNPIVLDSDDYMDHPIIVSNDKQGSIRLLKQGKILALDTPSPLAGVTFQLYQKNSSYEADTQDADKLVAETTTAANGELLFTNIDAGSYWLKESKQSNGNLENGFVADNGYEVRVSAGAQTTSYLTLTGNAGGSTIMNDSTFGRFQIKKVDQGDSSIGLQGAVFEVFSDAACKIKVDELTTDQNGTATSKLLAAGTYYLKEKTAPQGYFLVDEVIHVNVTAQQNTTVPTITNARKQVVEIIKKNSKTDNVITALTGAEFAIYDHAACDGTPLQTITVKDDQLLFADLQPDTTYWVKELIAPDGYVLSSTIYPIKTNKTGSAPASLEIKNDPYGSIKIEKLAQWSLSDHTDQTFPLDGAVFTLYDKDEKTITTATSKNGFVTFQNLVAGTYYIEETKAPTGFHADTGKPGKQKLTVVMGEENSTFTGNKAYINYPDMSKFTFTKTDPNGSPLLNAQFKLQKKTAAGYEDVKGYTQIVLEQDGSYASDLLEAGEYRLLETKAEEHFALMDPIDFTLQESVITNVTTTGKTTVVNEAKGNIALQKYSDADAYDLAGGGKKPLSGAQFTLFEADGKTPVKKADGEAYIVASDDQGKVVFEDVDPGSYVIKETKTPEGYQPNNKTYPVSVASGKSTVETYYPNEKEIINESIAGRMIVSKTDQDGKGLTGAIFEIYQVLNQDQQGPLVDRITTDQNGFAFSKLLDAAKTGTNYLVKEVQAPDGYTLDEQYGALSKIVTVLPLQDIDLIKANAKVNGNNYAVFQNTPYDQYKTNTIQIKKGIQIGSDNVTSAQAPQCLLKEAYTAIFTLRDLANGYNAIPAKDITVTDTDLKLWYYENSDPAKRKEEAISNDSYTLNSITLYSASMDHNGKIYAKVQYQQSIDTGNTWHDFLGNQVELSGTDADKTYHFDLQGYNAKRFRVVYTAEDGKLIQPNFKTKGIDVEATFAKRPSDATKHEIREITNQAQVSYGYPVKDETGKERYEQLSQTSNEVVIRFPRLNDETPYVAVNINADNFNPAKPFSPGNTVYYTIKAENRSDNAALAFEQPIISFDLPIGMSLNDFYKTFDTQFLILLGSESNAQTIDTKDVDIVISDTTAKVMSGGSYVETDQKTKKVTMTFRNLSLFSKADTNLFIKFAGTLSQSNPATTGLFAPVYLNSAKEILLSAENPYGNSFLPTSEGTTVADKDLDTIVDKETESGDGKKYVYNNVEINVTAINNLNIYKQVKGQYNDTFLGSNNIASTAPNGLIDYKIVLADGKSDEQISKARIVDILPFKVDTGNKDSNGDPIYYQDTFTNRSNAAGAVTERTTTLTKRPIYAGNLVVKDSNGKVLDPSSYIVYYCVSDGLNDADIVKEWTKSEREGYSAASELPMLYGDMHDTAWTSSAAHPWTTQLPSDPSKITAIGVEVDFKNALMPAQGTLTVNFQMTAPTYSTDQMEEVQSGLIVNSAMGAVGRVGHDTDKIADADRIENDPVKVRITLPKGSIGDYAFYDINKNGIQDSGDVPVAGLQVKLHTLKTTKDGTVETIKTTTTDQNGYYLFDQLDCNNMIDSTEDAQDPDNYVGNVIYQYWVEFATPEDETKRYTYEATTRYAGMDTELDSNITEIIKDGVGTKRNATETISLTVETLNDGTLVGEDNRSLDAGFKALGSLGDYVWIDQNRNGIQDSNEPGVADVKVRLYKANADGAIGEPIAETTTDQYGYYIFEGLLADQYVVEFDVTGLSSGGYSPYTFTVPFLGSDSEADSNANRLFADPAIARSNVIDFADRGYDMSIDAGLVYHSALSGLAFEDRNYTDMQDHALADIPLTGTIVELYQVTDGVRGDQPIATTTVDKDGKYFFDHLIEGDYQVKFTYPKGYEAVEPHMGDDAKDSDVSEEISTDLRSGFTPVITIAPNTLETHWDGGAVRYGSIGDFVWEDSNKDGVQDKGEAPISGVPVYLFERFDQGAWGYRATTSTNEHGYYLFDHLEGSDFTGIEYRVVFGLGQDTTITTPLAGKDVEKDSNALAEYIPDWGYPTNAIILGYGQQDLTWDAGIIHTSGSVGDYVWFDTNRNGLQDEENTGIEDIEVILEVNTREDLDDLGWVELASTTTNSFGYYRFDDLQAGYYRVKFKTKGYQVTLANVGNDEKIDSDGLAAAGDWHISRPFYLEDGGFDMTWDCGVYKLSENTDDGEEPKVEQPPIKRPGGTDTADRTNVSGYLMMLFLCSGFLCIATYQLHKNRKRS